jgi:hypothetical protein
MRPDGTRSGREHLFRPDIRFLPDDPGPWAHHDYVNIGRRCDLLEVNVKAMSKCKHFACLQIGLDALV